MVALRIRRGITPNWLPPFAWLLCSKSSPFVPLLTFCKRSPVLRLLGWSLCCLRAVSGGKVGKWVGVRDPSWQGPPQVYVIYAIQPRCAPLVVLFSFSVKSPTPFPHVQPVLQIQPLRSLAYLL
jgi:hypothetical protein